MKLKLSHNEIRQRFLAFFEKNNHKVVSSSSIIPAQDPTLLFANAGMNQFKDLFLGLESRSYKSAATSQKCVRAGGKHNDLDEVGFTDRHLTFFEMLGNFSFGAYFKKEAIEFAWEFITKDLGIDKQKLHVTIHESDDEAGDIWHNVIGLPREKIIKMGDEDNFWQMGDTGPCGPCTEIFYDRGEEFENKMVLKSKTTRYLEIWNLVFMQFEQQDDGSRVPLKQKGVDTGMGLERLTLVLQDAESIFDTSMFRPIFDKLEQLVGKKYDESLQTKIAFNVVGDHLRSSSMIIADGGKPSNDGRGYVLRKIIRRGLLYLKKLTDDLFVFPKLAVVLADEFATVYPNVSEQLRTVEEILNYETVKFAENLTRGQKFFEQVVFDAKKENIKILSGEKVFKLYDTYGFPLEASRALARDNDLDIDTAAFDKEMEKQRANSQGAKAKKMSFNISEYVKTEFVGYQETKIDSKVVWCEELADGRFFLVTEKSPFFVACGGQVSDQGAVLVEGKEFKVLQVFSQGTGLAKTCIILEIENPLGLISVGKTIDLVVNPEIRANTARNHTGTHLLQAALQSVLGKHVMQAGSLVEPGYLKFFFTHPKQLTPSEITAVELLLNSWILQNIPVEQIYTDLATAEKMGAIAIFGEKYNPEVVRIIKVGAVSSELCGGTHVNRSGDIGLLKIVSDEAGGAGIRVIIAVTGPEALRSFQEKMNLADSLVKKFACKEDAIFNNVEKLEQEKNSLSKENSDLKRKLLLAQASEVVSKAHHGKSITIFEHESDLFNHELFVFFGKKLLEGASKSAALLRSKKTNDEFSFYLAISNDIAGSFEDLNSFLKNELKFKVGGRGTSLQGSGSYASLNRFMEKLKSI